MSRFGRNAILLAASGLAAGLGACFIESAQPSTFRFECSSTDECSEGEQCSDGLCQQPCGANLEACEGATLCVNGFCSSLCPTDQDVCPDPQQCVGLSDSEEEDTGGGSGICTILCDDADHPCADGQLCLAGFCATTCMTVDDCGSGEDCTEVAPGLSVCVPSSSGGGGFP
jgi:hypothetical protein